MKVSVPKDRDAYIRACADAGVSMPYCEDFAVLRKPLALGNRVAPNRIVYQPMEGCDGTPEGQPGELTLRKYDRLAAGGAGIIWAEAMAVLPEARANPRQLYFCPANEDSLARLCERIKTVCLRENGFEPLVIAQLTHSGRYSKPEGTPAPLIAYHNTVLEAQNAIDDSRILTDDYLDRLCEQLIHTAGRAKACGFDGADIKCCHRYLLSELLSAYKRPGKYGGSFENRTRLYRTAVEESCRLYADDDFLITSRMNLYDGYVKPEGFCAVSETDASPDYTEAKELVKLLASYGVKLLNFTMGNPYFNSHVNRPYWQGGYESPEHPLVGVERMLSGVSEAASVIPQVAVISSGLTYLGSAAPHVAAGYIENGGFAFAGFGRQTLAYPELARVLLDGQEMEQNKLCLACSKCTAIMRRPGGTPGCVIRDTDVYAPIYRALVTDAEKK